MAVAFDGGVGIGVEDGGGAGGAAIVDDWEGTRRGRAGRIAR